jgi:DNA-binding response OmpR family regulator
MKLVADHTEKVLTDRMISEAVWGASHAAQAHSLHAYVGRLHEKLEATDGAHELLLEILRIFD